MTESDRVFAAMLAQPAKAALDVTELLTLKPQ